MSVITSEEIISQFGNELAGVVSALAERPTIAEPCEETPGAGYLLTIVAATGGRGTLYVHLDQTGADQLARRALGASEELPQADVLEAIKDMCGQVVSSIVEGRHLHGVRLIVESVNAVATAPAADSPTLLQLVQEGSAPVRLALWGTLEIGAEAGAGASAGGGAADAVSSSGPRLDVILDMELPLIVRFGTTEMPLKALTELAPGTVIDLGRSPDDPVDILVSNQIVARGEVVVIGGNYGVRITDIISPADRVRCMEAFA